MGRFAGKDIVSALNLSKDDVLEIMRLTSRVQERYETSGSLDVLRGKLLAALFWTPSTRTRLSFEAAMHRMGGGVIGFADPSVSRAGDYYKETLKDTISMVNQYADVIAMRHPERGAAAEAASHADIPVINGGDGNNEHPTQALLDLYSIYRETGRLEDLHVCMVGDQTARTMRAFTYVVSRFPISLTVVSPPGQNLPDSTKKILDERLVSYQESPSIKPGIGDYDVIYMESIKNAPEVVGEVVDRNMPTPEDFLVDANLMRRAKPNCVVLHSLPRTDELAVELDGTRHARYFRQAYYGMVLRMALLAAVLGADEAFTA